MFSIINACSDLGVHVDGANKGPILINERIVSKNVLNRYVISKPFCIKNKNHGNLKKNFDAINYFTEKLHKVVTDSFNNGLFPITIGGDHTIAMASALASLKFNKNIGVLWIDAHSDFNTFETTETGNIHGLPLAAITGLCKELTGFITNDYVNSINCVIIGARSIDKEEFNNLKKANVTVFTTNDIKEKGVDYVLHEAFNILPNNIHVSYDLDIIDPQIAPGVSIPAINGIDEEEAYLIMDYIKNNRNRIKSLDLVEYNPSFDKNNKTLNIAYKLLTKFIDE